MRRQIIFVVALAMAGFVADEAFAKIVSIGGTHSSAEIKSTCGKVGGEFFSEPDGGYGCAKKCTAKEYCTVGCEKSGKCKGSVPRRTAGASPGRGLAGILRGSSTKPPMSVGR